MIKTAILATIAATAVLADEGRVDYFAPGPIAHNDDIEIVGGVEAEVGKHLYVTGLRRTPEGASSCGASLIAPKVLLTAAHCAVNNWAKNASIGSHFLRGAKDGERIEITKITPHPKYDAKAMTYDYAIMELKSASSFTPVEVYFGNDAINGPGVIATARGWGTVKSSGAQSEVLKEVNLKIWDNKACNDAIQKGGAGYPTIAPTNICAGGVKGEDTCQGDSGGPLTVKKNGVDVVIGLTSWGIGCAQEGLPGIYARVSEAKDFIAPYIPATPTTKPAC
ncbi:chymotrypsin, serine protease family S01A [Achlya hypogyna]|uniref:Chymotrypsin, serine protease family S01A n=1 Tax=Achlya hypogyna TaxID=1202772 RepID=A0A0A7CN48_ACHHY|nr:secreted protein [Achlya hypogyna]OQR93038.1 chymotrypsin, serine protease family S01A [Achlya hypogyna]